MDLRVTRFKCEKMKDKTYGILLGVLLLKLLKFPWLWDMHLLFENQKHTQQQQQHHILLWIKHNHSCNNINKYEIKTILYRWRALSVLSVFIHFFNWIFSCWSWEKWICNFYFSFRYAFIDIIIFSIWVYAIDQ